MHWCPGCEKAHAIYVSSPAKAVWTFDGNVDAPTFSPSVRISWNWPDEPETICHYFLTAGQLNFCADSTHELSGQTVPLPDLPAEMWDDKWSDS